MSESAGPGSPKASGEPAPAEPEAPETSVSPGAPEARWVKGHRVTLRFAALPLVLPGESPPEASAPSSTELALGPLGPDEAEPPPLEPPTGPAIPDEAGELAPGLAAAGGGDGWSRLRSSSRPSLRRSEPMPTPVDALELVGARSRPPSSPRLDLAADMADRFALGDFTGALRVAELLLGRHPEHRDALRIAQSCREHLIDMYAARLAAVTRTNRSQIADRIPRLAVLPHEVRWLGLDHRQGFLLSRIDGLSSIQDLEDLSGMSRLELLKTLVELIESGAIRFD